MIDDNELDDRIELGVRRYFDHFLNETLPCILEKHERACGHGKKFLQVRWLLIGFGVGLGVSFPQLLEILKSVL